MVAAMRREREVVGPKMADPGFSDLNGWHRIEVQCFNCEHVHEFDPEVLKRLRIRQLHRKHSRVKLPRDP
jgi:ribosomal protein L20A (L18A)